MTPTATSTQCPLCANVYLALSQHLRRFHHIKNETERNILLHLASGRVNIRKARCPVSGCTYHSTRLDMHLLNGHPELTRMQLEREEKIVKKNVSLHLLADLRASEPSASMVSMLDMQPIDEDEQALQPVHDFECEEEDEQMTCQEERCARNRKEIKDLEQCLERTGMESQVALKNTHKLTKQLREAKKVLTEVSTAGWEVNSIILVVKIIIIIILSLFFSFSDEESFDRGDWGG